MPFNSLGDISIYLIGSLLIYSQLILTMASVCLFAFSLINYLPGPNLFLRFSFKHIIRLTLILIGVIFLSFQLLDYKLPHLLPIIITGNTETDFNFHIAQAQFPILAPSYAKTISLPFHNFDLVSNSFLTVLIVVVIASYTKFVLNLEERKYYYFVIGSLIIISLVGYNRLQGYQSLEAMGIAALVSIIIYKFSKTGKLNYLVCLICLSIAVAVSGIYGESTYQKTQKELKVKSDSASQLISKLSQDNWQKFASPKGGYSVMYPANVLVEDSSRIDAYNRPKITEFEANPSNSNIPNEMQILIYPGATKEGYHQASITYGVTNCDPDCHKMPISYKEITLNGITADQYSWDKNNDNKDIETVFLVGSQGFRAELTYPKNKPAWLDIYNRIWSSLELIKN